VAFGLCERLIASQHFEQVASNFISQNLDGKTENSETAILLNPVLLASWVRIRGPIDGPRLFIVVPNDGLTSLGTNPDSQVLAAIVHGRGFTFHRYDTLSVELTTTTKPRAAI
jgi:hypothetical protein